MPTVLFNLLQNSYSSDILPRHSYLGPRYLIDSYYPGIYHGRKADVCNVSFHTALVVLKH